MNRKQAQLARAARGLDSEQSYATFDESVMSAAKSQAAAVVAEAEKQAQALYESLAAPLRTDPVKACRAEAETRLARTEAAQRQKNREKLLHYRGELVNALFAEAAEDVEAYTASDEYLRDMDARLAAWADKAGAHSKVYVRRADEARLAPLAKKHIPGCAVAVDRTIRMGGFKLETGHVRYDVTLDWIAREQREAFLGRCGLRVE